MKQRKGGVPVTPSVLAWARQSAGLSLEGAAKKLSSSATAEFIAKLETGELMPTYPQLRKLANAYRRPTAIFFLAEPPRGFQSMHDFRGVGATGKPLSPSLTAEIRFAHERRNLAIELLEEIGSPPPQFTLLASKGWSVEKVSTFFRSALSAPVEEQIRYVRRRDPFGYWREKIESAGVLVFQCSTVPLGEMLGFSISEKVLPVATVNSKNKRGRVFTLIHELCHLAHRISAICDLNDNGGNGPQDSVTEAFCNAVASATLLPAKEFSEDRLILDSNGAWDVNRLDKLANRYGVSAVVVAGRLRDLNLMRQSQYGMFLETYRKIYASLDQNKPADSDYRPDIPKETIRRLGSPFVKLVIGSYLERKITLNDASGYLGVRVKHVPNIRENLVSS